MIMNEQSAEQLLSSITGGDKPSTDPDNIKRLLDSAQPLNANQNVIGNGRVTMTGTIYHESPGDQPFSISIVNEMRCETLEQPYQRAIRGIGEEWRPLETGWLTAEQVGLVVFENLTGRVATVNPTEEQLAEQAQKFLEIGFAPDLKPVLLIPPKLSLPMYPSETTGSIMIRSRKGLIDCKVTIFPR